MAAALNQVMDDLAGDGSVMRMTWNHLDATNNTGAAIAFSQWADRSVMIQGTFNNAAVVFEGSNDNGNNYLPLTTPQGNVLNVTTATLAAVTEACGLVRPRTTSGGVNQDVVVSLLLRRATQLVR
jgi:hypothetical protein